MKPANLALIVVLWLAVVWFVSYIAIPKKARECRREAKQRHKRTRRALRNQAC